MSPGLLDGVKARTVGHHGEALQLVRQLGEGEVVLGGAVVGDVGEVPVHGVVLHHRDPGQGGERAQHELCADRGLRGVGVERGVRGGGGRMP